MSIAERLLDAHTAFWSDRLDGEALTALFEAEIDHALALAAKVTLEDVVTRESVTDVALKYVDSFDLPGAIPDVAGEIAMRVRADGGAGMTLGEVVPREHADAVIDVISGLSRTELIDAVAGSRSARSFTAEVMHSLATDAVANNRRLVERIPFAKSTLAMGERVAGGAVRGADQLTRDLADRLAGGMLERWRVSLATSLTDEQVGEALRDLWDEHSDRRVHDLLETVSEDNLVDVIVLAYETWLHLRHTEFLRSLVGAGVDYFFDTYGAFTLDELLAEFGLGRDDLLEEAQRFGPPALAALREAGLLEPIVRRQLASFYDSPAAQAILAGQ